MIDDRYSKNLNALSKDECKALLNKSVLVAGCGGLGCYVVEALMRVGIGSISVVDYDVFSVSNLNRQLYSTEKNIGQYKIHAAKSRYSEINSGIKFRGIVDKITKENCNSITKDYDVVIDCLDSYVSRFWLSVGCNKNNVPIIFGSIAGWFGQVCSVFPGDVSYVDIYGSMENGESQSKDEGNLAFSAAIVANIQASQSVSVLLDKPGVLRNKILMIDLLNCSFEIMNLE